MILQRFQERPVRGGPEVTIDGMEEQHEISTTGDDTAAFQRFYADKPAAERSQRGVLYRMLIGWWRDRP